MRGWIMTYSIAGLTVLLSSCFRTGGNLGNDDQLQSTWQLDTASHHAIVNHCVENEFTDNPAIFTIKRKGEELILQFKGQHNVWVAPANKKYFYATQVIKSSVSGRFCNFQTEISIYFRFTGSDQNKITGTWRATSCNYCPTVYFNANKLNEANLN